jgi:hypothetical protein
MKIVAVAFLVAACFVLLTIGIALGWRRQAVFEARLADLDTRLRSGEEEMRLLKEREAAAAMVLRGCVARGEALVGRLREIDERGRGAAGDGQLVSRSELDEVVSAVNELVDTVDGLTATMDAKPQAGVLQHLGNGVFTSDSLSFTPQGTLLLPGAEGDSGMAAAEGRAWLANQGLMARDLLDATRVIQAAAERSLSAREARARAQAQALEQLLEQTRTAEQAPEQEALDSGAAAQEEEPVVEEAEEEPAAEEEPLPGE